MDQRRSNSLNRFLVRRAMRRTKDSGMNVKPPASYYREIRWKFSIGRRMLIMRSGFFGLEVYWGAVVPLANNVSVDEKRWGIIVYPIFRIIPGATCRCLRLMNTKLMEEYQS